MTCYFSMQLTFLSCDIFQVIRILLWPTKLKKLVSWLQVANKVAWISVILDDCYWCIAILCTSVIIQSICIALTIYNYSSTIILWYYIFLRLVAYRAISITFSNFSQLIESCWNPLERHQWNLYNMMKSSGNRSGKHQEQIIWKNHVLFYRFRTEAKSIECQNWNLKHHWKIWN